jgi:hypothetical protein
MFPRYVFPMSDGCSRRLMGATDNWWSFTQCLEVLSGTCQRVVRCHCVFLRCLWCLQCASAVSRYLCKNECVNVSQCSMLEI